jgi:hypothetical protein
MTDAVYTLVDFASKDWDTHGAVTTGASWKFTAPLSGRYRMCTETQSVTGGGWATTEQWTTNLYKNGIQFTAINENYATTTHAARMTSSGCAQVSLVAGDYIDMRLFQNSGAALNLSGTGVVNWVEIDRVSP